ncbi:MAG: cytochrome c class [Sphingomonas bacterium]|nr:c-type cytochrome [Sphingomonas bacterium]MDB5688620.1 cytochrome c class [Sphingomonas bacterium]
MPHSLRFVLLLTGLATLAGIASVAVLYGQDAAQARTTAEQITGGHADAGKAAMLRYGCGACHQIPGISGAQGQVGPSLRAIGTRSEIAGVLANDPQNLIRWIRDPQEVVPGNGMPDQGISEGDARDIAAYLYTIRR